MSDTLDNKALDFLKEKMADMGLKLTTASGLQGEIINSAKIIKTLIEMSESSIAQAAKIEALQTEFNTMWGIKCSVGILPFTIRSTRRQCIKDYCERRDMTLRQLQKIGHTFAKVSVMEAF